MVGPVIALWLLASNIQYCRGLFKSYSPSHTDTRSVSTTPTKTTGPCTRDPPGRNCINGYCNVDRTQCVCVSSSTLGYWSGDACTVCAPLFYGLKCTTKCTPQTCSGHGICNTTGECTCYSTANGFPLSWGSWSGKTCSICAPMYFGASCSSFCDDTMTCSGHGHCSALGGCVCLQSFQDGFWAGDNCGQCAPGYSPPDCGLVCPSCGGHGICNPSKTCTCFNDATNGRWDAATNCTTCIAGFKLPGCTQVNVGPAPVSAPVPLVTSVGTGAPVRSDFTPFLALLGVGFALCICCLCCGAGYWYYKKRKQTSVSMFGPPGQSQLNTFSAIGGASAPFDTAEFASLDQIPTVRKTKKTSIDSPTEGFLPSGTKAYAKGAASNSSALSSSKSAATLSALPAAIGAPARRAAAFPPASQYSVVVPVPRGLGCASIVHEIPV